MTLALGIVLVVITLATVVVVMAAFLWAAKKDGDEQRERDRLGQVPPRQR